MNRIIIIFFAALLVSCNPKDTSRTAVQTTNAEIPQQSQVLRDESQPPPLESFHNACLEGRTEEVKIFIKNGMDVNLCNQEERSALMLAGFNGHKDIVKMLLSEGADVNKRDMMGRTALMYASTGHFPETVKLLLNSKANPNIVDNDEGFTALMFAGAEGNPEVVKLLLSHKADPLLQDKDGDTAESFARQNGHTEVADLLKNAL